MTMAAAPRLDGQAGAWASGRAEDDGAADDDCFFESLDRVSSSISFIGGCPCSSSDSDVDAGRCSFASAVGGPLEFRSFAYISSRSASSSSSVEKSPDEDYGVWMAEPMSIEERRRRLLQGMGLASRKDFGSARSASVGRSGRKDLAPAVAAAAGAASSGDAAAASSEDVTSPSAIVRSKSDTGAVAETARVQRLVHLLGTPSPPRSIARASSMPACFSLSPRSGGCEGRGTSAWEASMEGNPEISGNGGEAIAPGHDTKFCTIKDLDTGKEFVIDELTDEGSRNRLSDPKTGLRLTIEEFEKSLGYSPIVKELMRRANFGLGGGSRGAGSDSKKRNSANGSSSSDKRRSGKKGIGWLKNIKGVANSVTALMLEKEREAGSSTRTAPLAATAASSTERMKVRQRRKPHKELTGLYLCQEIQAHQGSIWTIKFSQDAQLLASAGEDRVIHIWQVIEGDDGAPSSFRRTEEDAKTISSLVSSPDGSAPSGSPPRSGPLDGRPSHRSKSSRISSSKKSSSLPPHIIPGAVFSLSKNPICSFHGHQDDVLDLSWSKSQVRHLCFLFSVTCIQFNPIDDRYFISGSLDAKVRIWNIPDRQVVDWTDLNEMVTAACYTPDGQGAIVGSHKGNCRFYSTSDGKLHQKAQIEIQNKKRKSNAKKITGFQFVPGNPSEVLITSADSQVRVFDGTTLVHKFRGFRNTSSQISASFTADGNYVVCASEDSHVYLWKPEGTRSSGGTGKGKTWITTRSYEHFHCKDVSVAIPWPPGGSSKTESPILSSWSRQKTHQSPLRSPDLQQPVSSMITVTEDVVTSCRSQIPPLPKKSHSDQSPRGTEEEVCNPSHSGQLFGGSSSISASNWLMSGAISSISALNSFASLSSSSRWHNGGGNRSTNIPASTAWGLVVVTAGLGGEIKIYQNFGIPRLLSRQSHIF
ncbi:hypothetical protein Taro_010291 [Colocasia esculenta]|uniref:WD repeat-containing protein 44 n=1 Tax=Colocasia esculenta TaxID=4460 RepID=A0A843UCJ8_COLES|nr:hypothetical protein [Colocasia esculenta]